MAKFGVFPGSEWEFAGKTSKFQGRCRRPPGGGTELWQASQTTDKPLTPA
jgi:hypothetical protein